MAAPDRQTEIKDSGRTFVYVSEGVKLGPHPLLDSVEQLHAADPLQLLGDPVSETCRGRGETQPPSSSSA